MQTQQYAQIVFQTLSLVQTKLARLLQLTQDNDPQFENSVRQLLFKLNVCEINNNESPAVKFSLATSDLAKYLGVEFDTKKYADHHHRSHQMTTPKLKAKPLQEIGHQSPSESGRLADYFVRQQEVEPIEQLSSLTRKFVIPQANGFAFDEDSSPREQAGWGSKHQGFKATQHNRGQRRGSHHSALQQTYMNSRHVSELHRRRLVVNDRSDNKDIFSPVRVIRDVTEMKL